MSKIRRFDCKCPVCGTVIYVEREYSSYGNISDSADKSSAYLDGVSITPSEADDVSECPKCHYASFNIEEPVSVTVREFVHSEAYKQIAGSAENAETEKLIEAESIYSLQNKYEDAMDLQKTIFHYSKIDMVKREFAEKYCSTFEKYINSEDAVLMPLECLNHLEFLRNIGQFDKAVSFMKEMDQQLEETRYYDIPYCWETEGDKYADALEREYKEFSSKYELIKKLLYENSAEPYVIGRDTGIC